MWRQIRVANLHCKVLLKGQDLLNLEFGAGVKLRDSLRFLPGTPLSAMPKMFGLVSGPKGDFPHTYVVVLLPKSWQKVFFRVNTPKYICFDGKRRVYAESVGGKVLRFPPLDAFWPQRKRPDKRAELEEWHATVSQLYAATPCLDYCPEEELIRYCR